MAKKAHRLTKKVKCNGLVKRWTLDKIKSLTYMTIGEVFDGCEFGSGVLSKIDSDTLSAIKRLNGLIKKINFPKNLNEEFWNYLKSEREAYKEELDSLNELISSGVLPIHYRDIFNQGGLVEDKYVTPEIEQRAFKALIIMFSDMMGVPLGLEELENKYHLGEQSNTYINPRTRYERFLNHFYVDFLDDGRPLKQQMYDNAYDFFSPLLNGENIELRAMDGMQRLLEEPQSYDEEADEELYEASQSRLLYDDRYCFTTEFGFDNVYEDFSSKFRETVEYICTIPSKSNPFLLWQLLNDCRIIEDDLTRWKNYLKTYKSDKSLMSDTNSLIATYNEKMKAFTIPSLIRYIAAYEFPDLGWSGFEVPDATAYVSGVTAIGIDVNFEFRISPETLNEIQRKSHIINGYKDSNDNYKRLLFQMYSKYNMDFLIRYMGLYDLDRELQHAGLNTLCMMWKNEGASKIASYNGRFFENYTIEAIVGRDKGGWPIHKPL